MSQTMVAKASSLTLLQDNQVITLKTFCKGISYFTSLESLRATEDNSTVSEKILPFHFTTRGKKRGEGFLIYLDLPSYTEYFPTMAHYRGKHEI